MPADAKPELDKELAEIRREVIESRNLVIKTDNLLKNLHAEVKAVGKRQEDSDRKQWLSSAVAYVLFALLCIGGSILFATAKGSAAKDQRERLEKEVADLTQLGEKQQRETSSAAALGRQAAEAYRLLGSPSNDERIKGLEELAKLDASRLTSLERQILNDKATVVRRETAQAAIEHGRASLKRNEPQAAIGELTRLLALNPSPDEGMEASFLLGSAYHQEKKWDLAIPPLARYVADPKVKTRDFAMLLLAQAYEQAGQLDRSAEVSRDALGAYPASDYAAGFRARLTSVAQKKAAAEGSPPPAPAPKTSPTGAAPAPGTGNRSPETARAPLKPPGAAMPPQ